MSARQTAAELAARAGVLDVSAFLPDGATWARTPGMRSGLFARSVQLDTAPALASVEGRPASVSGTDPLAFSLAALGAAPSDAAPAVADVAAVAAAPEESTWSRVAKSGGLALCGLVLVAAGAFALTRGD